MSLDFNKDGEVNFTDLSSFLQSEKFGMKVWVLLLIAAGGWLYFLAPRTIKRKFGIR